jgi:FtsH-binding integral membrane protein
VGKPKWKHHSLTALERMATAADHSLTGARTPSLPGRRFDHAFFSSMALVMLLTVFVGFAHTYYLAGLFLAPLPSRIIQIHGAVFSCWILLLVTQTSLVSAKRVDIHRRLGVAGFFLGCFMVVLGVVAATDSLARGAPAGRDPQMFYIVPLTDILIFAVTLYLAFRTRSDSSAHKRFIYIATIALLTPAIARLPFAFVYRKSTVVAFLAESFLLILVAYDLWSTRRIHRATLWAGSFLVVVLQIRVPIGKTAAWHAFSAWVQHLVR